MLPRGRQGAGQIFAGRTRKSRKPAVEELWFPINDQQEGSGAVDLVQQLEYAEVMGHDEL